MILSFSIQHILQHFSQFGDGLMETFLWIGPVELQWPRWDRGGRKLAEIFCAFAAKNWCNKDN